MAKPGSVCPSARLPSARLPGCPSYSKTTSVAPHPYLGWYSFLKVATSGIRIRRVAAPFHPLARMASDHLPLVIDFEVEPVASANAA